MLVGVLRNLNFLDGVFEKHSNVKLDGNSSSWSRVVPCGRTEEEAGKM